jgi:hypothetical protein
MVSIFYPLSCFETEGRLIVSPVLLQVTSAVQVLGTTAFLYPRWLSRGRVKDEETFDPRTISPTG